MATEIQYRRTRAGDAELQSAQVGLSVPERKALSKLNAPLNLEQLGSVTALTPSAATSAVARLEKNGLVELIGAAVGGTSEPKMSQSAAYAPATGTGLKLGLGALAAIGAILAGWQMMKSPTKQSLTPPAADVAFSASTPLTNSPLPTNAPATIQAAPIEEKIATGAAATPVAIAAKSPEIAPKKDKATEPLKEKLEKSATASKTSPPQPIAPAPSASPVAAPIAAAPAPIVTAAAPSPTPAPVLAPLPTPAAAPAPAVTVAPVAPPVAIAAAAPRAAAAPAPVAAPKLISREDPIFPRTARAKGVSKGTVLARVAIDGAGNVTNVEIMRATPPQVFDREVVRALSTWKYERTGRESTSLHEFSFVEE